MDDAVPLVERDPTPPLGIPVLAPRPVVRSRSGAVTVVVVATAVLSAVAIVASRLL